MSFKIFADAVNAKFIELSKQGELFSTNVSKEELHVYRITCKGLL
jgi:hypothetical protein